MKDPLRTHDSAYDVLAVGRDADRRQIEMAYMKALAARRFPPAKAQAARNALLDPVKRALANLLEYDMQVLGSLNPNPLEEESVLLPQHRAATAAAWERQLKSTFPDPKIAHTLALFWYWWTLHEEMRMAELLAAGNGAQPAQNADFKHALLEHLRQASGCPCPPSGNGQCPHADCPWGEDCRSSAPPLEMMWHRVIGHWGVLAATADVWSTFHGVPGVDGSEVRKLFLADLRNTLLELGQRYASALPQAPAAVLETLPGIERHDVEKLRAGGIQSPADILRAGEKRLTLAVGLGRSKALQVIEAARRILTGRLQPPELHRTLEGLLATELRTGDAMVEVGVKTKRGKIRCGVLMLQHLGLLDTVRGAVETAMQKKPDSEQLKDLRYAVLGYTAVLVELERDRPAEALVKLEMLPAERRRSPEAVRLKGRALHRYGRKQAEVGNIEGALESWEEALACVGDELAGEIRTEAVSACHAQAVAMQKHQRDRAIDVLERGLRVVPHNNTLEALLGMLVNERAVTDYNKLHDEYQAAGRPKTSRYRDGFRRLRDQFRRAADLGCKPAGNNAEVVDGLLIELGGACSHPTAVMAGTAVFPSSPEQPPCTGPVPGDVAAIEEHRRQGNEAARRSPPDWDMAVECLRRAVAAAGPAVPAQLRQELASHLANRGAGKVAQGLQMITHEATYSAGVDMILAGEEDLAEALAIDPNSELAKKQWDELQQVRKYMPGSPPTRQPRPPLPSGGAQGAGTPPQSSGTPSPAGSRNAQRAAELAQRGASKVNEGLQMITRDETYLAGLDLLLAGEADLMEAIALDPNNDFAEKNLAEVQALLRQMPDAAKRRQQGPPSGGGTSPPAAPVARPALPPPATAPATGQRSDGHAMCIAALPPVAFAGVALVLLDLIFGRDTHNIWNWGWLGKILAVLCGLFVMAYIGIATSVSEALGKTSPRMKIADWYWQKVCKTPLGKKGDENAEALENVSYVFLGLLFITLLFGR